MITKIKIVLLKLWAWILSFFLRPPPPKPKPLVAKKVFVNENYKIRESNMGFLISHGKVVVHITKTLDEAKEWIENKSN